MGINKMGYRVQNPLAQCKDKERTVAVTVTSYRSRDHKTCWPW